MEISNIGSFNSAVSEFDTVSPVVKTTPEPVPEAASREVSESSPEYIVPEASRSTSSTVDTYA